MNNAPNGAAIQGSRKVMGVIQNFENVLRDARGQHRFETVPRIQLRQVAPIDVLHHDVEVARHLARLIDRGDTLVDCAEPRLQLRPKPFRTHDLKAIRVRAEIDEFQRNPARPDRIFRFKDAAHAAGR